MSLESLPSDGPALARELRDRYPDRDWLTELSGTSGLSREQIDRCLQEEGPVPAGLLAAATRLSLKSADGGLRPLTNDTASGIEVDREAGMVVSPSNKGMPSKSGSDFEMGTQDPKAEKNAEFLPFRGVPEFISPLHKKSG